MNGQAAAAGPIHIALAFDDNFWAPAYAVMRSACLNTPRRADLVFHLCHDGLREHRRPVLETIATEFGAKLVYHPLSGNEVFETLCRNLPVARRLHSVIYARLFLDRLLPETVDRVVYLDCDTMVAGDIAELWEADLAGRTLAAVADPWRLLNVHRRDLMANRDLFDPATPYFNSGVLVIDRARYADADIEGHIRDFARRGITGRLYYDQDMLNLIFRNDWTALDWRWNVIDPRMAHQAMNPRLLHYTGKSRPWAVFSGVLQTVAFARLYRHVMTNSVFYRFARERWARFWLRPFGHGGRRK